MIASGSEPEEFEEEGDLGDLFDDDPLEDISLDSDNETSAPPPTTSDSSASQLADMDLEMDMDLRDTAKPIPPKPQTPKTAQNPVSSELSDIEKELDLGGGFGNPGLEEGSDTDSGHSRISLDESAAPSAGAPNTPGKTKQPPKRAILKRGIRCPYCEHILPEEDQIIIRKDKKKLISNLKDELKSIDSDNPARIGDTAPNVDLASLPKCPNCNKEYIPREIEEESKIWGNATSSTGLILLIASGASMLFLAFQIIGYYFIPAPDPDKGLYEGLSLWMAIVRLGQTSACCVQPASFCALGLVAFDYFFGSKSEDSFKTKLYTVFAIIVSMIGLSMVLWASMSMTPVVEN